MTDKTKGYLFGSVAAATYGMNPLFTLPLYAGGMNADSVLFFRYMLALPILAFMTKSRGHDFSVPRAAIVPIVVLGLLLSCSSLFLYQSYNYMDAGIASTLLFVYPIMVAVIMATFFKEKVSVTTMICIALALVGIALLYEGDGTGTLSLVGVMLVMGSSLSYAIYLVFINRSTLQTIPTVKLTFYLLAVGWLIYVVRTDFCTTLIMPSHWYDWICVLALASLPTCVSFVCTTRSIQYIGSTPTAILGALEPMTAVFFGVLIFGEALTPRIALGMALILVAVTLIIAGGSVTTTLLRFRKLFPIALRLRKKKNRTTKH